MNIEISLEDLLKNGSHFGHNKKRWNPKMEKYIYGEKWSSDYMIFLIRFLTYVFDFTFSTRYWAKCRCIWFGTIDSFTEFYIFFSSFSTRYWAKC